MLICSQLPGTHFCKELSPVPAGGLVPIPAPPGWSQVTVACCTQGAVWHWGVKPLATNTFPSLSPAPWPWQKRDSSFSLSWEVTPGEGTWECLERKKPLGFWSWTTVMCSGPWPGDSSDIVSVALQCECPALLKPPGLLCHQLTAPQCLGTPWSFRGRLGILWLRGAPRN